jgi:hypothetical protein
LCSLGIGDLSRFWLSCFKAFGFIAPKTLNYLAFQSLVSEKKIFEISANQSILLALAAMLNIRLERKTVIL